MSAINRPLQLAPVWSIAYKQIIHPAIVAKFLTGPMCSGGNRSIQMTPAPFPACMRERRWRHYMVSIRAGSHDADVYSYNCEALLEPLLVEVDCHWLAGTTVVCCVIQVVSAL